MKVLCALMSFGEVFPLLSLCILIALKEGVGRKAADVTRCERVPRSNATPEHFCFLYLQRAFQKDLCLRKAATRTAYRSHRCF